MTGSSTVIHASRESRRRCLHPSRPAAQPRAPLSEVQPLSALLRPLPWCALLIARPARAGKTHQTHPDFSPQPAQAKTPPPVRHAAAIWPFLYKNKEPTNQASAVAPFPDTEVLPDTVPTEQTKRQENTVHWHHSGLD